MCQICQGTKRVKARDVPGLGWRSAGVNGEAKCNRPEKIWTEFCPAMHQTLRTGMADCPLCVPRRIEKTETGDHGWSGQFEQVEW